LFRTFHEKLRIFDAYPDQVLVRSALHGSSEFFQEVIEGILLVCLHKLPNDTRVNDTVVKTPRKKRAKHAHAAVYAVKAAIAAPSPRLLAGLANASSFIAVLAERA
jgi:hypothetical protein